MAPSEKTSSNLLFIANYSALPPPQDFAITIYPHQYQDKRRPPIGPKSGPGSLLADGAALASHWSGLGIGPPNPRARQEAPAALSHNNPGRGGGRGGVRRGIIAMISL